MEINDAFLSSVEEYAALMFSVQEIATILEVDPAELENIIKAKDNPVFRFFQKGRLLEEAKIRKGIFDLAKNGSSPAQAFAIKLIENAKMDDL